MYKAKEGSVLVLECGEKEERYELLCVLKFNSVRKRMSVLVKDVATGKHSLLMKGADDTVKPLLECPDSLKEAAAEELESFSLQGTPLLQALAQPSLCAGTM